MGVVVPRRRFLRPVSAIPSADIGALAPHARRTRRLRAALAAVLLGLVVAGVLLARGSDDTPSRLQPPGTSGIVVIDVSRQSLGDGARAVAPAGFDVVFVCPRKSEAVAEAARAEAAGGTLLLFTMAPPGETWNADLFDLYFREVTVMPSYSCGPDDTSEALERIARREVRVADLVSHRFPVGDSVEAFARARALEGSMKVAITF